MKKNLSFVVLLFTAISFGQCVISGPSVIAIGASATYSVPAALAQCAECHDWDVSGSGAIAGSDQNNSVAVTRTGAGAITLNATYFDEAGCHPCVFVIPAVLEAACCVPSLEISFICRGNGGSGGTLGGFVTLKMLDGCDWSNVEKIYFELDSQVVFGVNTQLPGQASGYMYAPFTETAPNMVRFPISSPRCTPYTYLDATIYYKSSNCPPKKIWAEFTNPSPTRIGAAEKVILSPNPVKSEIVFIGKPAMDNTVTIFDAQGSPVLESKLEGSRLSVEKLKKGLYIYTLTDGKEFSQTGKFIKE